MPDRSTPDPSRVSFTAKLVAYGRRFSDIPFARDVAALTDAGPVFDALIDEAAVDPKDLNWGAPLLEARYKSLVSALHRSGCKQVLELASGIALRGLAMTRSPEWTYVESDLPGLTREKEQLIAQVRERHHLGAQPGLHVVNANALRWGELEAALLAFDPDQPVAVIHEGLMPYLPAAEKHLLAANIARILDQFGGVWITPDFSSRRDFDHAKSIWRRTGRIGELVVSRTGRDFYEAAFEDEASALAFCQEHGFSVEVRPQIDGSFELKSVKRLKISSEVLNELIDQLQIWTLRRIKA